MEFQCGSHVYSVRISPVKLFNDAGEELWALTDPKSREIVFSPELPADQRATYLRHEYWHVVCLHLPVPQDEESQAIMHSTVSEHFEEQFQRQGGAEELEGYQPIDKAEAVKAMVRGRLTSTQRMISDRMPCGCGADIMCGSIASDDARYVESLKTWARQRWAQCDACGNITIWSEVCDESGYPLGQFLQIPAPRVLSGAEAAEWMRDKQPVYSRGTYFAGVPG